MPGSHLKRETTAASGDRQSLDHIQALVNELSSQLPNVRPLSYYDHDHPLRPLAAIEFHAALGQLSHDFGCACYQSLDVFHTHLRSGRILRADLEACLKRSLGSADAESSLPLGSRYTLRLQMLLTPELELASADPEWIDTLCEAHDETVAPIDEAQLASFRKWFASLQTSRRSIDRELLRAMRSLAPSSQSKSNDPMIWTRTWCQVLRWQCQRAVKAWQPPHATGKPRLRNSILAEHQSLITSTMATFCRAFADPGVARWALPHRQSGFYAAFLKLQTSSSRWSQWLEPRWQRCLRVLSQSALDRASPPRQTIAEFVQWSRLAECEVKPYMLEAVNSIRGWAGLLYQFVSGDLPRPTTLEHFDMTEFMATLLLLDRAVLIDQFGDSAGRLTLSGLSLTREREREKRRRPLRTAEREYWLYRMLREHETSPMQLAALSATDWSALQHELNSFGTYERQAILQEAYELRYQNQSLFQIQQNCGERPEGLHLAEPCDVHLNRSASPARLKLQLLACLEPTEESYRRHLESVADDIETFGVPGFLNVDMFYKPADAHHASRQVPPNVWARHVVEETVHQAHAAGVKLGSRTALGSQSPRHNSSANLPTARQRGYTIDQMACIVLRLLADAGLTHQFARLVIVMGHQSSSANNLFEAADNCSFCGKQSSRANVQTFVQMANDYRVRELLRPQGVDIPDDCQFLGAIRNSCNDAIEYLQLDRLALSHTDDYRQAATWLERAAAKNARERCQFLLGRELDSDEVALAHSDERMSSGAMATPERGSAGNAICIIGPRDWTKGIDLEGRAFLVSYEANQDDRERSILARLMRVVVPVCTRVNLDYYFSSVAPDRFGAGPKAQLNIDALLGVSNHASIESDFDRNRDYALDLRAGDLRTGLPREMVNHHEPLRLLYLIDASRRAMLDLLKEHPTLGQLFAHQHSRLAVVECGEFHILRSDGVFERLTTDSVSQMA